VASDVASEVTREVRIAARPETIFAYFIDPAKMVQWKGTHAVLDPRPGGVYRVNVTGQDHIARGTYLEIVPHTRIVFTWGWEGDEDNPVPPGSTTVEVVLIPDGDDTIVRLTHRDLPVDSRDSHAHGWEHYLSRLKQAAEGTDPGPDPWVKPATAQG
jgi:uncharacterized protein YndB with AHSA1/START domain